MQDVNGTQLYYTIHCVSILGREAALQVYRQQDESIHVCTTHSKTNGRDQQEDRRPAGVYADGQIRTQRQVEQEQLGHIQEDRKTRWAERSPRGCKMEQRS